MSAPAHRTPNRREFLIGGALIGTAVIANAAAQRLASGRPALEQHLDRLVPELIGSWSRSSANDILIPKGEEPEDEPYDEVVTRYYTSASAPPVMLLIAYGSAQTGTAQLHRPEVCYPAAGFDVRSWPDVVLPVRAPSALTARVMTATAPGRIEQILYWSRIGNEFPTRNTGQRWAVLRSAMLGEVPDGALVRMSTIHPNRGLALASLLAFGQSLVEASGAELRPLLVGGV